MARAIYVHGLIAESRVFAGYRRTLRLLANDWTDTLYRRTGSEVLVQRGGWTDISPNVVAEDARLGDPATPHAGAARMFRWGQPLIGHQLPRIVETLEVASLDHHSPRADHPDTVHRLNSMQQRRKAPGRQKICDLPRQTLDPRLGIRNGYLACGHYSIFEALRQPIRRVLRTDNASAEATDPVSSLCVHGAKLTSE